MIAPRYLITAFRFLRERERERERERVACHQDPHEDKKEVSHPHNNRHVKLQMSEYTLASLSNRRHISSQTTKRRKLPLYHIMEFHASQYMHIWLNMNNISTYEILNNVIPIT